MAALRLIRRQEEEVRRSEAALDGGVEEAVTGQDGVEIRPAAAWIIQGSRQNEIEDSSSSIGSLLYLKRNSA
jgi:hypothetical protein